MSKSPAKKTAGLKRRDLLKSGGKILPALAIMGLAFSLPAYAEDADCGACSSSCSGSCLNGCTGSCMEGCTGGSESHPQNTSCGACSDSCSGSCLNGCTGSCMDGCLGGTR